MNRHDQLWNPRRFGRRFGAGRRSELGRAGSSRRSAASGPACYAWPIVHDAAADSADEPQVVGLHLELCARPSGVHASRCLGIVDLLQEVWHVHGAAIRDRRVRVHELERRDGRRSPGRWPRVRCCQSSTARRNPLASIGSGMMPAATGEGRCRSARRTEHPPRTSRSHPTDALHAAHRRAAASE